MILKRDNSDIELLLLNCNILGGKVNKDFWNLLLFLYLNTKPQGSQFEITGEKIFSTGGIAKDFKPEFEEFRQLFMTLFDFIRSQQQNLVDRQCVFMN